MISTITTVRGIVWAFRYIIREIMDPSRRRESPYLFMLIGIGHVMVGAAFAGPLLGFVPVIVRLAAAGGYWWVKERRDWQKGGALSDGLGDTAFVAFGLLYSGPALWPILGLFLPWLTAVLRGRP